MADDFTILDSAGATKTIRALDTTGAGGPLASYHATRDGDDVTLGAKADAAASSDTGTFSLMALFKRLMSAVSGLASTLPAGTNLLGKISAGTDTATLYNGATALTPKFKVISAAASGNNELVAAVGGKKIRVLAVALIGSGTAITIYFRTSSAGAAIFGDGTNQIPIDKTGVNGPAGFVLPYNSLGWFETVAGDALGINLSAAQGVAGGLVYAEV